MTTIKCKNCRHEIMKKRNKYLHMAEDGFGHHVSGCKCISPEPEVRK